MSTNNITTHTPGPWQKIQHTVCTCDSDRLEVAACNLSEDDATLISAAPDLLASLEAIIAEVEGQSKPFSSDSYLPEFLKAQARAAIGKANRASSI
jgi:hypothetical protein